MCAHCLFLSQVANSNCQMWVKFSKEGAGLQLLGESMEVPLETL